jgi:hypothetical protein
MQLILKGHGFTACEKNDVSEIDLYQGMASAVPPRAVRIWALA